MNIILVRHGKAEGHFVHGSDGERHLVEKGWKQARSVGKFLLKNELVPDVVLTSPLVRARETAEGICESLNDGDVELVPTVANWLQSGMSPEVALSELSVYASRVFLRSRIRLSKSEEGIDCLDLILQTAK